MADAIDEILAQWSRERPEAATWPVSILGRVVRLTRVLDREHKKFCVEHDLEPFEFDVLTTLLRSGRPYELTANELLKAAMVTSGAITNRIDRMETRGLVERVRNLEDRRSVRVRLTPRGCEVVDGLFSLHLANAAALLQSLASEEREQLASVLRTLLESLGDTSLK